MNKTLVIAWLVFVGNLLAQTDVSKENLQANVSALSSDAMKGRETGHEGQRIAAQYIDSVFSALKLRFLPNKTTYQQAFSVIEMNQSGTFSMKGKQFVAGKDFYYLGVGPKAKLEVNLAFELSGHLDSTNVLPPNTAVVIEEGSPLEIETYFQHARNVINAQPKLIVFALSNFGQFADFYGEDLTRKRTILSPEHHLSIPIVFVAATKVNTLLSKKEQKELQKGKTIQSHITAQAELGTENKVLKSSNLVGMLPGSDSLLKDEYVVVSAHYDHLGEHNGEIFNGADDNATGTSAVLEMARMYREKELLGEQPKRSVLFLLVSGEEKGLLGSEYYTQHPLVPLENTVADLNVDMIGRTDEFHTDPNYIYVIGSNMLSDELHALNEAAAKKTENVTLDYKYNTKEDPNRFYYRSDHYNFAKNGIPSIFYFSGVHADYHKPTDTVEKIDFNKMQNITELIFQTSWNVANAAHRPVVNHPVD